MSRVIDITGQRFGWLVAQFIDTGRSSVVMWVCKCDCGSIASIRSAYLRSGKTQSCGCQRQRNTRKHGAAGCGKRTAEYKTWEAVIDRCFNEKHKQYADYGGRGIVMCEEWRNDFSAFFAAVGQKPSPAHTIGRLDNDVGYRPGNVEWQTRRQQQNNMRSNRFVVHDGRRQTVAQWARELGKPVSTIQRRAVFGHRLDATTAELLTAHAAVEALHTVKT